MPPAGNDRRTLETNLRVVRTEWAYLHRVRVAICSDGMHLYVPRFLAALSSPASYFFVPPSPIVMTTGRFALLATISWTDPSFGNLCVYVPRWDVGRLANVLNGVGFTVARSNVWMRICPQHDEL